MFTTDITYIVINIILLICFIATGKQIASKTNKYWKFAPWAIITFTLVLGLRLNRGNDYIHYIDVYLHDTEDSQIVFTQFNHFLKAIGTGPHWIFMWYSGAFILGASVLLKQFREYAAWLFPIFLMAFTVFSEYIIRQAFGFSFVFLFLSFMLNDSLSKYKRWGGMILFFTIAYSIHSANAISCIISLLVYLFIRKPISPISSIPLYIFASYYLSSNFDFSYLTFILSLLGEQNEKFQVYTSQSDTWFSAEAMNDIYIRNSVIKLWQTLGDCSLIFLGHRALKLYPNKGITFTYNTFVIGAILSQTFFTLELLRRMSDTLYWFWAFPLAYVIFYKKELLYSLRKNPVKNVVIVSLLFFGYEYLKYLFMREEGYYLFLWDL